MNKKILSLILVLILLLSVVGCKAQGEDMPEDFSFSLTWNVNGISSYDSKTGKLVKEDDATNADDYTAYYQLTDEDKEYIYNLISELDIDSYPEKHDPKSGTSKPAMKLALTVNGNGKQKTVTAAGLALQFTSEDAKGQAFLSACENIINRLTATEAWTALPEYEHLYD